MRIVERASLVRSVLIPALTLLLSAGSGEAQEPPVVHDSAGVELLDYGRSAYERLPVWSVSDAPMLTIGSIGGDPRYELFSVASAVRMHDGRLVVANAGTHELRFYNADGTFIHAVGREGDGPGEFRSLGGLTKLRGDTLMAWDYRSNRVTILDAEGSLVRTAMLAGPGVGLPLPIGPLGDDGLLMLSISMPAPGRTGVVQDTATLFVAGLDGAGTAELGRVPYRDLYLSRQDDRPSVMWVPFGGRTVVGTTGRGYFIGPSRSYQIKLYTAQGRLERVIRRSYANLRLTDARIDAYRERRLASALEDPQSRQRLRRLLDDVPFPAELPAYRDILTDDGGNLWVDEYVPFGDPNRWTVFDWGGRMLATVETPTGFTIHDIGSDWLLGVHRDELGVEYVSLFALERH